MSDAKTDRPRLNSDSSAELFASASFLLALLALVTAAVPQWHHYFMALNDPISDLFLPIVPSYVYAALLYVLGVALRRRLRPAWTIMVVWWLLLPQVVRVLEIISGERVWLNALGFVFNSFVLVLAWRARKQFLVDRVPGSLRWAALLFVVGGAFVMLAGAWLVYHFGTAYDIASSRIYVLDVLLSDMGQLHNSLAYPVVAPWAIRLVIGIFGTIVIVGAANLLFRPPRGNTELTIPDEAAVRTLLRDHGQLDSLGYFATRRDKTIVWDTGDPTTAHAGVSFRPVGSVSLASGDPVGDFEYWPAAIDAWISWSRAHGYSLAVMGAGHDGATMYTKAGLTMLDIGDEAIVDLANFTLDASHLKDVRRSVQRLTQRGYTTEVLRHAQLSAEDFANLELAAQNWRGDGGDERGFSMALGRLGDSLDGDCLLVRAIDAEGQLRGFLSFVPWGRGGLSLDLMRRDPTADNGLIELMVAALAERSDTFGAARVSLNFAMMRDAFERGAEIGAGPIARFWRQALLFASKTWQLETLYRSNAKYAPTWQPRYMGFEYASDLPRVAAAAGSAEGFLTTPSIALFRRRSDAAALAAGHAEHAEQVRELIAPPRDLVAEALSLDSLNEQMRIRHEKLAGLREQGVDPYPVSSPRTHTMAEVRELVGDLPPDTHTDQVVSVAGRVMLRRDMGKLSFATLRDGSGDLQVMFDESVIGEERLDWWERWIDLGDHVSVTGTVITTRRGELSVLASQVVLASKALRPLPDKHKGLTDPEARVRARYVDLIVRPAARDIAQLRATVVRSVRDSLHSWGFTEAETPVLQSVHGGANARPFTTHINAYDLDLYLRIATELHLKRLIVGGMERVFELGRQFRNEGVDFKHNPEFTSLEVYQTFADYDDMRRLTQKLIQEAATAVFGSPVARRVGPDGEVKEVDLSGDWPVLTVCEAVSNALGEEVTTDTSVADLLSYAANLGLQFDLDPSWGAVVEKLYEILCEKTTTSPVFYTDFPKENAPLTRPHRSDPRLAEKWDLVMFGAEQATAYSELVDPVDQRERLVAQSVLAARGDVEAMQVDEDFLTALEYGMPPTGGMGLGIDRLVMNLTGLSIRETILFPLVKPQS